MKMAHGHIADLPIKHADVPVRTLLVYQRLIPLLTIINND